MFPLLLARELYILSSDLHKAVKPPRTPHAIHGATASIQLNYEYFRFIYPARGLAASIWPPVRKLLRRHALDVRWSHYTSTNMADSSFQDVYYIGDLSQNS